MNIFGEIWNIPVFSDIIPSLDFVARYTIKVIRSIQLSSGNRVNLCVRALDVHDLCYYVIWDRLYFFTKLSTSWDLSENLLITKLTFKVSARRLLWISFCIFFTILRSCPLTFSFQEYWSNLPCLQKLQSFLTTDIFSAH